MGSSLDQLQERVEAPVAEAELALKGEMQFIFDHGEYWQFEVRLDAVDAGPFQLPGSKVIESAGMVSARYPTGDL